MEELGGVAVWPQVSLGSKALTAQLEALRPVNNPPHPTPGFTLAAVGLVEGVTGLQVEDILGRLKCRHSGGGGCLCACVCWGGPVAGATLQSCLGLVQGSSCQFPDVQWGQESPARGASPLASLETKVDLLLQWTLGLVSPRRPWPLPTSSLH